MINKMYNKILGAEGELAAVEFLKKKKYKIIERNYSNRLGEIDIIALHKNIIVFVEVKDRSTCEFGRPVEAVDERKQQKIRKTAEFWLMMHNKSDADCRFDVLEVLGDQINHLENAF